MSFKPKSVETITAKLGKTLTELEDHAEEQLAKAALELAVAAEAKARHEGHKAEHERAVKVAGNIKALLN